MSCQRIAFCLGLAIVPAIVGAQTPTPDPLIGLWVSDTTLGPSLYGELTITRTGAVGRATLAGAEVTFRVATASIRFAFPGNRGAFRGVRSSDGRVIHGFWIQPEGQLVDPRDPGGTAQLFATPVRLASIGRGRWRSTVPRLPDRFTLYLAVATDSTGQLVGAFRNPDQNSHGGATQYRVEHERDSIVFSARPNIRHAATLVTPDRLRIFWPDLVRVLELRRRAPREAPAFFPRPPDEPVYVYRKPAETGDGWRTARADSVGVSEAALTDLVRRLIASDPAARRPSLIHSLLVARRGRLILEEYFFGFDQNTTHDIRSAGKTFASVMLGAAMRGGAKLSPDTRVYDVMSRMGPFANSHPGKARMTLAHLMTHTSGFINDDEIVMQTQKAQPNWWKYTLDLPLGSEPGNRYAYSSAGMNLMGGALTLGTRTWLPELFDRTIARPLDFGTYYWNLMPTEEGYLAGGAYLRPRDLMKIGQVYLDGGVWNGRRIVDSAWVTRSTSPHVEVSPASTGLSKEEFPNYYFESHDGFAWHLYGVRVGQRTYREYEANGNGGQFVIVIPELELVVTFTGGNYGQGGIWGRWRENIVGQVIAPAIRE
jgi:CubicO group peptidase (beta-lactamase class C family)